MSRQIRSDSSRSQSDEFREVREFRADLKNFVMEASEYCAEGKVDNRTAVAHVLLREICLKMHDTEYRADDRVELDALGNITWERVEYQVKLDDMMSAEDEDGKVSSKFKIDFSNLEVEISESGQVRIEKIEDFVENFIRSNSDSDPCYQEVKEALKCFRENDLTPQQKKVCQQLSQEGILGKTLKRDIGNIFAVPKSKYLENKGNLDYLFSLLGVPEDCRFKDERGNPDTNVELVENGTTHHFLAGIRFKPDGNDPLQILTTKRLPDDCPIVSDCDHTTVGNGIHCYSSKSLPEGKEARKVGVEAIFYKWMQTRLIALINDAGLSKQDDGVGTSASTTSTQTSRKPGFGTNGHESGQDYGVGTSAALATPTTPPQPSRELGFGINSPASIIKASGTAVLEATKKAVGKGA